ncbi:aspartate aminotransferase family protein [Chitinimonas sp.]|uniref:pyridoxal phosphate-dependent decarboxylase family protein n=1 Tax=Chitinimonas sp. TaxID=1934313 RepID=UPI0035B3D319
MTPTLQQDLARLDQILEQTCDEARRILASLDSRPVAIAPTAPPLTPLQPDGGGFSAALADFNARFAAGFSGSSGPRYLGFVTGGATPAALAADWLVSSYDQNPTSSLDSSAPDLEREALALLRQLFRLGDELHGAFVSGATMSNFVGLAIGREWLAEQSGISVAEQGLAALGPVTILSGTPHSSIYKAASMLGLGRQSIETIACLPDREAIDLAALEARLIALAGAPCLVVANAGTVNTVDFDDLQGLVALRTRYPFWLHIDAAFGAFAATAPAHAHLVTAMEQTDSLCIDLHKWLNVPYDAAVQFSRRPDLQLKVFQNSAAYLGRPSGTPDFVHLTPENSRRLRALPSWFALRAYGSDGVRSMVESCSRHARHLGELIAASASFKLLAPVRLNVVCFGLKQPGSADEATIQALIRRVRDDGEAFVTPTVYQGRWGIRAAFSNWRTSEADVERVWQALEAAARALGLAGG